MAHQGGRAGDADSAPTSSGHGSGDGIYESEKLIADVACALIRARANDLDSEINGCLKRIVLELDLDRSTIVEIDATTGLARFSHGWARDPYQIVDPAIDVNVAVPWSKQKMLAGETVVMSNPAQLPDEAQTDRVSFLHYGPKSNVMVPIKVGGTVIGAITFASLGRERNWSAESVRRLEAIAEIFACGLERKRASEEIFRLRDELTYISRVTTMGELAASMAHELNQPLAAILNNAEALESILSSDNPDLQQVREGLSDIIEDDERARQTIRRIWALFQRDQLARSEIDVAELLGEINQILRTDALIRNVSLLVTLKQPVRPIFAERLQLQQAIINLVLNAFDAVAEVSGPREVSVNALQSEKGDAVRILVRDSGKGIAAETMPKIFDAFFTTKPRGMGMGLAIAKSIVETNGGQLSASPNEDRGTTFEIILPASHPHPN